MKWFCFLAEVPYGGELYISIDYGFKDFLESNGGGAPRSKLRGIRGAAALRSNHVSRSVPKLDTDALYPRCKQLGI